MSSELLLLSGVSNSGTLCRAFCSRSFLWLPKHKSCGPWHSCLSWPCVSISVFSPSLFAFPVSSTPELASASAASAVSASVFVSGAMSVFASQSVCGSVVLVWAPAHDATGGRVLKMKVEYNCRGGSSFS